MYKGQDLDIPVKFICEIVDNECGEDILPQCLHIIRSIEDKDYYVA